MGRKGFTPSEIICSFRNLTHKRALFLTGFTLIELLLYLAVVPFILLSISAFFFSFPEARVKNQTIMEVEEQGAFVMNHITQTIRNAKATTSPLPGSSAASLSLDAVQAADDPTIFDLSNSAVRITEGLQSPIVLTNSHITVSNLQFQNLSRPGTPGIVRVQFTLHRVNPEGRYEYNYQKTFYGSANIRQ